MLTLVLIVVFTALVFEYINGFHDTANSIATVVATKVLSPMQAVGMAAFMNLLGALAGTAVAQTIASGIIDAGVVDVGSQLILCALLGGIIWNLITWWFGLPSSSSHALIGGLIGAALAAAVSAASARRPGCAFLRPPPPASRPVLLPGAPPGGLRGLPAWPGGGGGERGGSWALAAAGTADRGAPRAELAIAGRLLTGPR